MLHQQGHRVRALSSQAAHLEFAIPLFMDGQAGPWRTLPGTILEPGVGPFPVLGTGVALLAIHLLGTHLLDSANQVPIAEEND